jgi:CYTH domain-containing protein
MSVVSDSMMSMRPRSGSYIWGASVQVAIGGNPVTTISSATTELEFELTFLASSVPGAVRSARPNRLVDVYFPVNMDVHPRVRLRQKGDRYEFTKKTPAQEGDASQHVEQSVALTAAEFADLAASSGRRIEKDRYQVDLDGRAAEVDVFRGDLEGLVLIDFEFDSHDELGEFVAPACCGPDVTQEDFIAGGLLAGRSYADIQPELHRLGYEPIVGTGD